MARRPIARSFVTLLALIAIPAPQLAAQQHPNHVQGFQPERLYQLGELDHVNLFNGNLTVQIPLGGTYSTGGGFSYQLTLSYTGNIWEYVTVQDPVDGHDKLMAVPRSTSNAGLGWQLSFGALDPLDGFRSPDGAAHSLRSTLHPSGPAAPGFSYTTDGTYLRLNSNLSPRVLEAPDGTRRYFDAGGRLTRIDDRFDNSLTIDYVASAWAGIDHWKLTDSQGRIHWIYFKPSPAPGYPNGVVERAEVRVFGGGTATYTFSYSATEITRGLTDSSLSCLAVSPPETLTTVTVPLLTGIAQPGGTQYGFAYDPGPYHADCQDGSGNVANTNSNSGHLVRMTLPTRGSIEWSWNYYLFPKLSERVAPIYVVPPAFFGPITPFSSSAGVVERRMVDSNGSLHGRWTYQQSFAGDPSGIPREGTTTVTDPLGHQTTHYFSVYACRPEIQPECPSQDPDPSGWSYHEYGLPFTRNTTDGTGTRFLSSEVRNAAGSALRRTFVRYESSGFGINPRPASERIVYLDDGGRFADTDHSDFDGLGHYRRVRTDGNFDAGNVRETYTDFNAGSCATCTPSTGSPWVLGTYTFRTVTEGGATARAEACFEAATGFLLRTRMLKTGTTRGAFDLVTRYSRNGSGDVTAEEHFGGDTQALGTGALCGLALPAAQYRLDHTYQFGSLRTSRYAGMPFTSADYDIDFNTGLVKTSRDVSGLATTYLYDALGRPTWVRPAQEGWTELSYNVPAGTTPAKVFIYRRPNGGGTPLAEEQVHFDPFGRVAVERRKMPDGSLAERKTTYLAQGWLKSRTEWGTGAGTTYLNFDPFGRPGKIRPPEGSAHDLILTYFGVRRIVRKVMVGTGWTGSAVTETQSVTHEYYDRQGRLREVREPANPDGSLSKAVYSYDVGGRLARVDHTARNAAGANVTQTRLFNYDNRGFLSSERHPELGGPSGNGIVSYHGYDARGHAGRILDGRSDLLFTYDGAERLTLVEQNLGFGLRRPLKQLTFGTGNGAGDWRLGKLQQAKRYNYPVIGGTEYVVAVTETYAYGGEQGRVSRRDTESLITVGGAQVTRDTFTQSWTWNDLGGLASLTYPRCTHAGCGATAIRTVTPGYTHGWLTAVPGYASAISYHVNGMVNQIARLNGTTDTYGKDSHDQPRPRKIDTKVTSTGTVRWHSGLYSFDGAGNLTRAGNAYFLYDPVSRLAGGLLYLGPGAGGATAAFSHSYDGFGNVQASTTTTTRNSPTDSATNHLTAATYDGTGNQTSWNGGPSYVYDPLNKMSRMTNGGEDWIYVYTADDERLMAYDLNTALSRWTLRDLDGKVLRRFRSFGGWSIERDYVYRGSQLLAAHTDETSPDDLVHYHLDHLGTPRAITNRNSSRVAYHVYFPFGEEASNPAQDDERMKFTGHERDLGNPASPADDLDYMHARFYNPQTARFLSVDPVGGNAFAPQSWNAYAYALGNPLKYTDPLGLTACVEIDGEEIKGECYDSTTVVDGAGSGSGRGGGASFAGLGSLYSRDISRPGGGLNTRSHLTPEYQGLSFDQMVTLAVSRGEGGTCDQVCQVMGLASTPHPLYSTIVKSWEYGLGFAFGGGPTLAQGGAVAVRTTFAGEVAVGRLAQTSAMARSTGAYALQVPANQYGPVIQGGFDVGMAARGLSGRNITIAKEGGAIALREIQIHNWFRGLSSPLF